MTDASPSTARAASRPTALEQAGLESTEFATHNLRIRELAGAAILRLHSLQETQAVQTSLASSGIELPGQPNQSAGKDPSALCLRPSEWLLFSEFLGARRLFDQAAAAIDPDTTALLDASDALATFRLTGPAAPWLLSKLSCLDFLSGGHGQHCARTALAWGKATAVIHYHQPSNGGSDPVYDLIFCRSLAAWLWDLMRDSAPHAEQMCREFRA